MNPMGTGGEHNIDASKVDVTYSDEVATGVYSNNVFVAHSPEEFYLDFGLLMPPNFPIVARVILSPGHAKRLVKTLQTNIEKYEKAFGSIPNLLKASQDEK